ncbi:AAA family ATPase [Peribacillus sp. B-H-3]|uniref:AAA family ATPase n=1 Tax=Peribacillus sp. B-H-3 TaxID=3400420 RepID=UPI003B017C3F
MRPLHLVMQAFGPYAGKETINFEELESRTMFVISGKTGAGKTTIFDGISFAIYGKASGEDRNGMELRSQFAQSDLLTEVALTFELRGKTYYIVRSPQQERRKKSGEGTTIVNAKAELYEIEESSKKLLGSNVREVEEKIKQLMGLDANQFRQILMIPQGEFRKLLTSESKDKEQILQKLFHTEMYKNIEEKLKEEAALLKKQSDRSRQERVYLIRNIQPGDNEELRMYIAAEDPNENNILPLLTEELYKNEMNLQNLEVANVQRQNIRDEIKAEIIRAEGLIATFQELERKKTEKKSLELRKSEIDEKKSAIALAQRAIALEKQEHFYLRIGKQLNEVRQELDKQRKNAETLKEKKVLLEENYEIEKKRSSEREEVSRELHRLQQLKGSVEAFSQYSKAAVLAEKSWKDTEEKKSTTEKRLKNCEETEEKLLAEKRHCEQAAVNYAGKERETEKNQERLDKITYFMELFQTTEIAERERINKEKALNLASGDLLQERSRMEELNHNWMGSQASLLAQSLIPGEACPVCGAADHPNPAASSLSMPSEAQLKKQQEILKLAEEKKSKAEAEYYKADIKYSSLLEDCDQKTEQLKKLISAFQADKINEYFLDAKNNKIILLKETDALRLKRDDLPKIENQLALLKEEKNKFIMDAEQLKTQEEQARLHYLEARAKLSSLKDGLPEEIRTPEKYHLACTNMENKQKELQEALDRSLTSLQKAIQEEAVLSANIHSLSGNEANLAEELAGERNRFKEELLQQGFDSYGAYTASKKSEAEIVAIEHEIIAYEQKYHTVTGLYHQLELTLKGISMPDINGMQKRLETADSQIAECRELFSKLAGAIQENNKIKADLERIKLQQKELDEKFAVIGHLHEISKGQNPFRITFERYVLAAFLDDILKEANLRLIKMTSGRYQLLRKIDPTRKNIQSGLELSIYDQYTGQERHVKTLSGGESFKAALALALGLADVVQSHSGGISLETMFIDEGFGTLDPESLDQAIEALMDIQSSGRLVGIISHVPELKERIDAQLEVISTQKGSRTEFHFTG